MAIDLGQYKHVAAGILPFFSDGRLVLLGLEFRDRYSEYFYMEFGGKRERKEKLSQTAWREFNEETGYVFDMKLEDVEQVEERGNYVDFLNEKTGVFYRMYYIKIQETLDISEIMKKIGELDIEKKASVEKVGYRYFCTCDILHNDKGVLPEVDHKLYPTMIDRLKLLRVSNNFRYFLDN